MNKDHLRGYGRACKSWLGLGLGSRSGLSLHPSPGPDPDPGPHHDPDPSRDCDPEPNPGSDCSPDSHDCCPDPRLLPCMLPRQLCSPTPASAVQHLTTWHPCTSYCLTWFVASTYHWCGRGGSRQPIWLGDRPTVTQTWAARLSSNVTVNVTVTSAVTITVSSVTVTLCNRHPLQLSSVLSS